MVRLAVVGAGIGGCSAAYFARQYIPSVQITIYEAQDRLGGRILTHHSSKANLEVGASFFNSSNKIIRGLVESEQFRVRVMKESRDFVVWNGSEFVFKASKHPEITKIELLAKYKSSLARTFLLLRKAKKRFAKLYNEANRIPSDIVKLFEFAELSAWYKKRFDELLIEGGANQNFIDEVAAPITRTIYNQNADLGGLAGISSFVGVYSGSMYSLADGNASLPIHLAERSRASVKLGKRVDSIERISNDSCRVSAEGDAAVFDWVIIAAPLELADIKFEGFSTPDLLPRPYQKVYKQTLRGKINPRYFGLDNSAEPPAAVLTTKEADPITQFSFQKISSSEYLLTTSSTQPLNDEKLHDLFKDGAMKVYDHFWKAAYPKFRPLSTLPTTQIGDRIMYLNSIESSVSSMETAAFSALNAIKMLDNKLK